MGGGRGAGGEGGTLRPRRSPPPPPPPPPPPAPLPPPILFCDGSPGARRGERGAGCPLRLIFCALLIASFSCLSTGCARRPEVTVYCAHDREFADAILRRFTDETKIDFAVR